MKKLKNACFVILALCGVFMFFYGGYDDSPGGQLLGLLILLGGVFGILATNRLVIDIELTLNRFGFGKIAENKFQFLWLRFSRWQIPGKYSISIEVNWRAKEK